MSRREARRGRGALRPVDMPSLADTLLLALYALGHIALMLAVCNRFMVRLRDTPGKTALMAAYLAAWPALAVVSALWIGPVGFAESFLFRAPWPQKLLAPWQWLVCAWVFAGIIAEVRRRRGPLPTELLARQIRLRPVAASAPCGPARLLARGDLARLEVCELTLAPARLPADLDGLRIAHLSDLHHDGEPRSEAFMAAVAEEVRRAAPDMVAITGDIVPFVAVPGSLAEAATTLGDLGAGCEVYAVLGNHDFWADAPQVQDALERRGVRVLRNEGTPVKRGSGRLWLAGLDDHWSGLADLDAALRGCGPGDFCVLLAHNPDAIIEAARRGIDLQLSGHTHGGQVALPLVGPLVVPSDHGRRFAEGLHKVGPALLWVSRGQSVHLPIRVGSTPQVTLITLRVPRGR